MIKKLLREGLVKVNLTEGPKALFDIVKDYYQMSGDDKIDSNNINELYVYLKEEEEFDPLGHGIQPTSTSPVVDKNICLLSFSEGNEKLDWPYLSLPAGYTCPFATACKNFAAKAGQKFKDKKTGKESSLKAASDKTTHMCYAARAQAQYPVPTKKPLVTYH